MHRYEDSQLYRIRHSMAHILAQAVLERFPEAKIAIGPPIEAGFYYDFDLPRALHADDLAWIENRMKEIIRGNHEFIRRVVSIEEARQLFADQPYKLELIDGLLSGSVDEAGNQLKSEKAPVLTVYQQDSFKDLCRGPHVANTSELNPDAFSIRFKEPSGAYWRGDEKRPMLTRIYGTAWENADDLAAYIEQVEAAKQRDHRKLGVELGLFAFSSLVGKGLPLWKPRGAILRNLLENFLREAQLHYGYQPVMTPHIADLALFKTSGHYDYYSDHNYHAIDVDGEMFMLKPVNCPHHIEIYRSEKRSYRDLPLRLTEFGSVYRYEQSGELSGLTRVRGFTQDDAHLFVTPEQLLPEFLGVVDLIQHVFGTLGLHYDQARIGIRDPQSAKYIGSDSIWEQATNAIIDACRQRGMSYTIAEGEAAFYGPKLDFIFRDALKREWQLGTVQVDYSLPERFGLEYIGADGKAHRPIMIHRAPFGSLERFIGILTEHYHGAFPLWLAPVQMAVLPVSDKVSAEAQALAENLKSNGFRVEVFDRGQLGAKIRDARSQKIPYLVILGPRNVQAGTVSIRLRDDTELEPLSVADFVAMAHQVRDERLVELVIPQPQ